jgi:thioredoxin reductase
MNATVDKFDLRSHMNFGVECLGAEWKNLQWEVKFLDTKTGNRFVRTTTVLISAVGGISYPRDIKFDGMERFKGAIFHSARWNHKVDYTGKRMAVIGNGCSAAQIVPKVAEKATLVKQYAPCSDRAVATAAYQHTNLFFSDMPEVPNGITKDQTKTSLLSKSYATSTFHCGKGIIDCSYFLAMIGLSQRMFQEKKRQ